MQAVQRTAIHDLVESARRGENPCVITRLETGWVALAEYPFQRGHCVLWSDPVVFSINDLDEAARMSYSRDLCRIGDALLKVCGSYRINYETLCNGAQALHSHVIPRYMSEPEERRRERAAIAYPLAEIERVDLTRSAALISELKAHLHQTR